MNAMSQLFLFLPALLAALSASPARSADFPEIFNTEKGTIPLSSPTQAVAHVKLPEGFRITLAASEPAVRNPIAMAFDARGRLWIAENYTYAEASVNFEMRLRDRVLIFEDTNGDGQFDSRQVFWDGAQKLTSVEVGFGGVWLMCPPQLLFIPDRNGDDQPDGPPEVMLDGFDADKIRHNFANGLKWGPDGWLYGRHGITTSSFVGRPGTPPEQRVEINCSIWRYHPTRRTFDVVARGGTNPWGHDWDEFGELFYINTVIGHLWHAVPGAYTQRMFGEHGDPYLYGVIGQTADHFHWDTRETWNTTAAKGVSSSTDAAGGGHAHSGMMIYQGTNWPESHRGRLFTVNLHGHRLNSDVLERSGAGFVGRHGPDFGFFDDPWFRAVELGAGPDGGVFLIDWSDIGECHENDGVHRGSGRIYKITHEGAAPRPATKPFNLSTTSSAELADSQFDRNEWTVRQSRRILEERAAAGVDLKAVQQSLRLRATRDPLARNRLRALWALFVTGGAEISWLNQIARTDKDEHLRAWALRLIFDNIPADITTRYIGGSPSSRSAFTNAPVAGALSSGQRDAVTTLRKLAREDASGLVRLHIASLLQKLPPEDRLDIAGALAADERFASDEQLGRLVWYGAQPAVAAFPARALKTLAAARMPVYRQSVARRLMLGIETHHSVVNNLVKLLGELRDEAARAQILAGMCEAVRGWRKAEAPAAWAAVAPGLTTAPADVSRLARELSVVFGDGRAVDELRKVAADRNGDLETRKRAIEALVQTRTEGLATLLLSQLDDHNLAPAAVRGIAALNSPDTAEVLLRELPRLYPPGRAEVVNTLSSRPGFALALLSAVKAGRLQRQDVPAFNIRQMRSLEHPDVTRRLEELWPPPIQLPEEKEKQRQALKAKFTPARIAGADRAKGRETFKNICGACHKLFGEGAAIGPDLTGSDRRNLDYLLENILEPSAIVAADYRVAVVTLKDDRVLNGIVGLKTERTIELQTPTEKLTLERSEIESIEQSQLSLMPEGLIDPLPEDQVLDLLGYLMTP
jgi:putative membrane-bound dehydrogenase-like protein